VLTPPEGQTGFKPGSIGTDKVLPTTKMINMYKKVIQHASFDIVCLGKQENSKGNIVFYLVVESNNILDVRRHIAKIVSSDPSIPFKPIENYDPHITVGFIGGDVFDVSKGADTCVEDVILY